ncbi:Twin-arginine translocation pathway signal [Rhodobacteraceae bacterium NNCM2]|nr:Twin-arginine translocation pathway signal [Coraliihabitans acroporae]
MANKQSVRDLTRRELLASGVTAGAALVVGTGFVAHTTEAWATETKGLAPATMATIIQVARDTYPHDKIADQYYAIAVKGHDDKAAEDAEFKAMMEEGVATLDAMAVEAGYPNYLGTGWERDRVAMLKSIEETPFFQTIRGGLVVGLYNQKEIWGHFGYEGASFEHGGYIERGFDDIAWL